MSLFPEEKTPEAATETPKGPRIEFVNITNIGPIELAKIEYTQSDLVVVFGKNGSGKSTAALVLEAIQGRFDAKALKAGAEKGAFEVAFSYQSLQYNCKLTLTKFTSGDESKVETALQFTDSQQKPISQQRAKDLVKFLVGDSPDFDINTFIATTAPAKRAEMLQKLSGVDLKPFTDAVKLAETARADANRDVSSQAARAIPFDPEKASMEPINAVDLTAERDAITKHNDVYERSKAKREEFFTTANQDGYLDSLETEMQNLEQAAKAEIERINNKLKEDKGKVQAKINATHAIEKEAKERLVAADKWLNDPQNQPKDFADINEQLAASVTTNEEIATAKRLKKEADELERLKAIAAEKEMWVVNARNAKMEAIKKAKLPAGLAFDPEDETGLLLNGQPIERASSGELTIAAMECGTRGTGALHWLHVDCKALDFENFELVKAWIKKQGWQALLEKPAQNEGEKALQFFVV